MSPCPDRDREGIVESFDVEWLLRNLFAADSVTIFMRDGKRMSADSRRSVAGYVLVIYFVVVGSFQLGRFGSLPFESVNRQPELNPFSCALILAPRAHTCPAQLFAQTAVSPAVVTVSLFVPNPYTVLPDAESFSEQSSPVLSYAGRAPPFYSL